MAQEGQSNVKKKLAPALAFAVAIAFALGSFAINLRADNDGHDDGPKHDKDSKHHRHDHPSFDKFVPGTIVLSRTVYKGTADTVVMGESLPPGCQPATTGTPPNTVSPTATDTLLTTTGAKTAATTTACGYASDNGEAPNLSDSHNVWNNANTDGSFGVSSPIRLDDLTPDGHRLGTLRVPSNEIVTSFSSKSELALNRSVDGKSLTFMGYRGGPACPDLTLTTTTTGTPPVTTYTIAQATTSSGVISPTAPNLIDVSSSNTPAICDPTNPTVASYVGAPHPTAYYRAVAEVDTNGRIAYTDGNAYSSDNSRAVMKADNWLYYSAGNDNNGNLSKSQLLDTQIGIDLVTGTGAELFVPGQTPPIPPDINMLGTLLFSGDKPGKDTNFRGLTIFDHTLYVSKGSGSNGVNTVYQVGTAGVLPTTSNAPPPPNPLGINTPATLNFPITILPGFPPLADAKTTTGKTGGDYPFGIWFANATTLYVCDEGALVPVSGTVVNGQVDADAGTLATAGLQKWVLQTSGPASGTWVRQYVINAGLNLGVPYSVPNYPASIEPATGGCRNIIGVVNHDGTATIWAITSTMSNNGDDGADPNKLVEVTDVISATKLATGDGDHDKDDKYDQFVTIRSARAGEAFRGIALAPKDDHDQAW
jgi:hypothetical protein